jgi:N-glycosylase/DNA lyase
MTLKIKVHPFSLKDTLECGQFFRYTKLPNTYLVQSSDRIFSLWQKGDILYCEGTDEDFLIRFLRLEEDLEPILAKIDRDPVIHQAIERYRGMRLIRQDPWECLLSFLCSSAKRVDHIRSIIESLCRCSGRKVIYEKMISYGFPAPLCIKSLLELNGIRAGFRASYLVQVNQCIDREKLLSLKEVSYKSARQALMNLPGVGMKIADCTLLYSLDFLEAFPVDTWMKKGLQRAYFAGKPVGGKAMEEFAADHFGLYAGYAQLYLYHYWRQSRSRESFSP